MILDQLAASTMCRVEAAKRRITPDNIKKRALTSSLSRYSFERSIQQSGVSLICEIKKASPSKGLIAPSYEPSNIARVYEKGGAAAISVLTEPKYFLGRDSHLREIKEAVSLPVLRKDFTLDEYQIYEARCLGADAVLLICALTNEKTLRRFISICDTLGLSALVEAHTEDEIQSALTAGARIIGVNNRNLNTFEVDLNTCVKLRHMVPSDVLFVAESGIRTPKDIRTLSESGVDAVLIGEALMRSRNLCETLAAFQREAIQ